MLIIICALVSSLAAFNFLGVAAGEAAVLPLGESFRSGIVVSTFV